MNRYAREDVRSVLADFGISDAYRAITADPTEEIILIRPADFLRVDPIEVTKAVMEVLPNMKVWVIEDSPAWETETL